MTVLSRLAGFPARRVRAMLADLPRASGYTLEVKPLRYRTGPHLAGLCDYETKRITVQVPEPFRPFRQRIPYRAQRIKARAAYCHEYYHYYLHDVLGRKGAAETACDRFALEHFRKRVPAVALAPRTHRR